MQTPPKYNRAHPHHQPPSPAIADTNGLEANGTSKNIRIKGLPQAARSEPLVIEVEIWSFTLI